MWGFNEQWGQKQQFERYLGSYGGHDPNIALILWHGVNKREESTDQDHLYHHIHEYP